MSTEPDLHTISFDLHPQRVVTTPEFTHPVRTQERDYGQILRKVAGIDSQSVPCTVICTAFDLIFTLITLVIGATNMYSCPVEPRIPIYLVVCGVMNLTSILFSIMGSFLHIKKIDDHNVFGYFYITAAALMIIILQIFNFIWLIIGTVWVFSVFNQVEYEQLNAKNYCQRNVYQYSLASVILQYMFPLAICCCKNITLLKN